MDRLLLITIPVKIVPKSLKIKKFQISREYREKPRHTMPQVFFDVFLALYDKVCLNLAVFKTIQRKKVESKNEILQYDEVVAI